MKIKRYVVLTIWIIFLSSCLKYVDEQTFDKGNIFPREDLAEFYEYWFVDPYEYMFYGEYVEFDPGKSITINKITYQNFLAGINGIVFYGGLMECMVNYLDIDVAYGFWDTDIIEIFTGLPLYRYEGEFGYYNPDIIIWGYTYMIPDPQDEIYGKTFQEIYDVLFARFFRLTTESYVYLNEQEIYEAEQENYYTEVISRDQYAIEYLNDRYNYLFSQYQVAGGYSPWTVGMSFGFWLRRGIDGTHDEFWTGLKKVMVLYDGQWLGNLEEQYPGFSF
ncbi:MAG: hypothetical protein APR63_13765 [Desulfuromonas sp. SDB]|nr:MAG: hypothetical protein APR63_13765 [Desulfuromonas sp. SDB]